VSLGKVDDDSLKKVEWNVIWKLESCTCYQLWESYVCSMMYTRSTIFGSLPSEHLLVFFLVLKQKTKNKK
jgi:hypothetical protein